ncbi:hypothetical protein [Parathalassolituus penaei]|uniref:Uncharacterized protein n=1 Tax=Parathalassolituus penaei TaxID=2997323 RepID=A0A9X3EB45_9GAMM|nr:hypothetical protein [Parathalassolituus penaei]MCY0964293.1 hypothetical protein [Parathalassolituus penaei]
MKNTTSMNSSAHSALAAAALLSGRDLVAQVAYWQFGFGYFYFSQEPGCH